MLVYHRDKITSNLFLREVIHMETRNWGLSEVERRLLKKWAAAIKVMTPKEKEKMLTVADTIILMKELKEEGRSA